MHVVEDQQCRSGGEEVTDPPEQRDPVNGRLTLDQVEYLGNGLEDGTQRGRSGQVVAGSPEHPHGAGPLEVRTVEVGTQRSHQRGLADACLPGDEHEVTVAVPSFVEEAAQAEQQLVALE